ncbi:hypothetical protein B0T24DRAFT_708877 [Lasiosphaeria ovina]|uniref:Tetratricopeptide repeat protein n=1 Tax=Lasiosphaeria ovina TaxID=92902 RepID=A0AAE0N251_9PEZI|nr:hypothetical protein B0T24DRAFT_708877 [Lasiosphaeria ovina]
MANVLLEAKTADRWVEVLKDSGWYLYERGEHEATLPIFESALGLARKREAENPTLMADVLMCLAALGLHTSTPYEVLRNSQDHFEIRCLWSLGRFAEAEEMLQEAVDADKREGNPPSYGLAGLLLPLSNTLASQGKLDAAALSHQKALDMFYLTAGDSYKTAQHHWTLAIEAFGLNKYYKREMARAQIKAGRYHLSLSSVEARQALLH